MRIGTLVFACLVLAPAAVAAQQPAALKAGDRVRITGPVPPDHQVIGTLISRTPDTIVVQDSAGPHRVAVATGQSVEVSRGKHGHAALGGVLGFLGGVGVGAVIGASSCEETPSAAIVSQGQCMGISIGGVAVAGLVAGMVVGALIKTERWEVVPPGLRANVTLDRGRTMTLGLSMSF